MLLTSLVVILAGSSVVTTFLKVTGIALGSQVIRVAPADFPTPSSGESRRLLRDAMRLTLWRATGSTGAWLAPDELARKRADCGV